MRLDIQRFAVTKSTKFTESNISVTNNTSSLKISIEFSANNSVTYFSNETLTCTCNGTTKTTKVSHSKGGKVSTSFTFNNIAHNNDGTKTVAWSWSCATGTSTLGTVSASGNKALTKISRASIPTYSDNPATLGTQITITTNRNLNTYAHTLTYRIGETTGTIGLPLTIGASTTWTPPLSLSSEMVNTTSGVCTITCLTYDEDLTLIGSTETQLQLKIPNSVVPSITIGTPVEADSTMISLDWGVFVQNKSSISIPITATGIYDSTIQSIITIVNNVSYTGTPVVVPANITGTNNISTTTTDSRGRSATTTGTFSVVGYANPNIEIAQVQRCLSDGTLSDNGTYLLIDFKGTISDVANNNSALWRIGYKKTTDLSYTYVTLGNNYTINLEDEVSTFTISSDYEYDIVFEATDAFTTSTINRLIDTGFDLLNFNSSGKSLAIGKVSTASSSEELLEVNLETKFYNGIDVEDNSNFDSLTIGNDAIVVVEDYEEYTGAIASTSNGELTYDITKTNYTPIGIVGYSCAGSRSSYINIYGQYLTSSTEAKVYFKNTHPSTALANDTTITIWVAYIRS